MTCGSEWYSRKGYYKQKILRPSGNPWAEGGFMQSMKCSAPSFSGLRHLD